MITQNIYIEFWDCNSTFFCININVNNKYIKLPEAVCILLNGCLILSCGTTEWTLVTGYEIRWHVALHRLISLSSLGKYSFPLYIIIVISIAQTVNQATLYSEESSYHFLKHRQFRNKSFSISMHFGAFQCL